MMKLGRNGAVHRHPAHLQQAHQDSWDQKPPVVPKVEVPTT